MNDTKVEKKIETAKKFMAKFDAENDYCISYKNAKTLGLYTELRDKQCQAPTTEFGVFFAYTDEQFKDGMAKCGYKDSDKKSLKSHNGGFGTADAWNKLSNYLDDIDLQIKEKCEPFEVLCYEYNNYECCFCGGLKREVVDIVADIWGKDATKEACKRFKKIGYDFKAV